MNKIISVDVQYADPKSDAAPERRYKRGYTTTEHLRHIVRVAERPCLCANVIDAVLRHASILAAAVLVIAIWNWGWHLVATATYVAALIFIARQQRVFELMVHDASHRAWARSKPRLNDLVANLLVAWPMASEVGRYWRSHSVHHAQFGSAADPCRRRFAMMGLDQRDVSTTMRLMREVIAWLPSYFKHYYKEVGGSPKRAVVMIAWHAAVYTLPVAIFFGLPLAILWWFMFWAIPMLTALPVLRSIAEIEEHDYSRSDTELETTFTNSGRVHRWLIHPAGDAYHQIHHLFPRVPMRRHHRLHVMLMAEDGAYRNSLRRLTVLGPGLTG